MKYALLVGINKHLIQGADLAGCVNDVIDLRDRLLNKGFQPENIRTILDERAVASEVHSRLEWLTRVANPGDTVLFHYSGHGSQVNDWNGDELDDHLDEILCCADVNWNQPLKDDDIQTILSKFRKGVKITFLMDCCHSATNTKSLAVALHGGDIKFNKSRYIIPPLDITMRSEKRDIPVQKLGNISKFKKNKKKTNDYVVLSACQSNQTAADAYFAGRPNGAFTFYLCKAIDALPNGSYKEIFDYIAKGLANSKFQQIPAIEGECIHNTFLA